jgi:FAD/FMN-containing dehydrogenase
MVGFGVCYCGPASRADRAMALIRRLATPMVDGVTGMDYVALQRLHDTDDPRAVAADLVTAIVDGFDGHPERATQILFQQSGGAIGRVAPGATAFSQRDARANMLASVAWPYGSDSSAHIAWCRQYWAGLEPFTYGFYTNDDSIELTAQQVASNYRQNLERLVAVKNRYDPSNLFRLNANVVPPV